MYNHTISSSQHHMLIHKNQAELQTLMTALQTLPIEGKDIAEVVYREWTRQQSLLAMQGNVQSNSTTHNSVNIPTQHTNHPTTVINDYWGLRLGLIRG